MLNHVSIYYFLNHKVSLQKYITKVGEKNASIKKYKTCIEKQLDHQSQVPFDTDVKGKLRKSSTRLVIS